MLAPWFELLPMFVARRVAVRICAVRPMGPTLTVVEARPGTYFKCSGRKCHTCHGTGTEIVSGDPGPKEEP